MKKLFKSTTINDEVLRKIREVNKQEGDFDEKRCLVLEWFLYGFNQHRGAGSEGAA